MAQSDLPSSHNAIVMTQAEGKPGAVWHPMSLQSVPLSAPGPSEVVIKVSAVSLQHRDVWLRKSLYPGVTFPSVLGSDCVGTVVGTGSDEEARALQGKEVLPYPAVNWNSSEKAPDVPGKEFGILGGTKQTNGKGAFAEYLVVPASYCVSKPSHLSATDAASLPLGALTAWRAVKTKGGVSEGMNVLITGIGGGVALTALGLAKGLGAKVWVTSGGEDKIEKAKKLGAEGGVSYKDPSWGKTLKSQLPKDRPFLDVVIDSAGGEITKQVGRIMALGGVIVVYGATTGAPVSLTIGEILQNIELKGSTMGSLAEFKAAISFISEKKIQPTVHSVYDGLEKVDEAMEVMRKGEQFGKLVVKVESGKEGNGSGSKL